MELKEVEDLKDEFEELNEEKLDELKKVTGGINVDEQPCPNCGAILKIKGYGKTGGWIYVCRNCGKTYFAFGGAPIV